MTGQHWPVADSDTEMSEAEVEAEVSGEATAPVTAGTDNAETEATETEADLLVAACAIIDAEVC